MSYLDIEEVVKRLTIAVNVVPFQLSRQYLGLGWVDLQSDIRTVLAALEQAERHKENLAILVRRCLRRSPTPGLLEEAHGLLGRMGLSGSILREGSPTSASRKEGEA